MALVSVVLTNYNNRRFLDEAIASVLAQSFRDWELVIVDDASTDDSLAALRRYAGDGRIRIHALERNGGYARALILGLEQARGEIAAILDSDDVLFPEALEKVHAAHTAHPEVGLVLTQMIFSDSRLRPVYATVNTPEHLLEPLLWLRGPTHFRSVKMKVYRRMPPLDPELRISVDWDLLFKMEETAPWLRIDEPLIRYRNSPDSLAHGGKRYHLGHMEGSLVVYRSFIRRRRGTCPNLPVEAVLARLLAAVRHAVEIGAGREALRFSLRSLRIAPFRRAAHRGLALALGCLVRNASDRQKTGHGEAPARQLFPIRQFQVGTGNIEPDRLVCIPLVHQEGHCLFGGDVTLQRDGRYQVSFSMEVLPFAFSRGPLVVADVYENLRLGKVLAQWPVEPGEVREGLADYPLCFEAQEGHRVEFRLFWREQCRLIVHKVLLTYLGPAREEEG